MYQPASAYNGRGASGPRGAACEFSSIAARVDTMHCYHLAALYSITFPPTGMNPEICGLKHPQKSRHHSPSLVSLTLRRGNFLTVWISLSPTRPLFFGPGIWVNRTWCFVNNSSRQARTKFLRPFNSDRIRERHVNRDKSHIALSQRVRSGGAQPHKRNSTRCHFYSPLAILLRVDGAQQGRILERHHALLCGNTHFLLCSTATCKNFRNFSAYTFIKW
jgi:hypothetical protein